MTASTLLATRTDTVQVMYSHFYIQDAGESWLDGDGAPEPGPPDEGHLVRTGPDWIAVNSGADYHLAGVRFEVWDSEPPQQTDWEASADFDVHCTTGKLDLVAVMLGPSDEELALGPPGTYQGRVYSRGGTDARAALETADEIPDGMEQYLIQFWPAPTPPR